MNKNKLLDSLPAMEKLYGSSQSIIEKQKARYKKLIDNFEKTFGESAEALFSSPGRTEISGNHTDHNNGKVLAASIDLDTIAAVRKTDNWIRIKSEGFDPLFEVKIDDLKKKSRESGTTTALIRGIASRFQQLGYRVGGFEAYFSSQVGVGSGLSSSASIEVLIGMILSNFYNSSQLDAIQIAKIGQYAENKYFGKPCGLMDQLSIAAGGVLEIDFEKERPFVKETHFDQRKAGLDIVIVDTGGNHADLTEDYASIPEEMQSVARQFKQEVCRGLDMSDVLENIDSLRKQVSDRAILRCIHFLKENNRVDNLLKAIDQDNYVQFLNIIQQSGNSSFKFLQNCYSAHAPDDQGVSLGLAITEHFFDKVDCRGACRVHGGGFAGTIQTFIDAKFSQEYVNFIEDIFEKGATTQIKIRDSGVIQLA